MVWIEFPDCLPLLRRKKPLTRKTPLRARKPARAIDQTDPRVEAARKIWRLLEDNRIAGLTFRPADGKPFADFVCPAAKAVILLGRDDAAAAWFEAQGWRVFAFDAVDAGRNPQGVLDAVADAFRLRLV